MRRMPPSVHLRSCFKVRSCDGRGRRPGSGEDVLAITPRDNEAFYREVDEELRRDQLSKGWQRYGKLIIGGVILLLAAIGGVIYWQHRQEVAAEQRGEVLTDALRQIQAGQAKQQLPKLDILASEGSPGYRATALLTKANVALQSGDEKTALAALETVSQDQSIAEPFRDLAMVRRTALEFDRLPPDQVISRLKPLAVAGNPWFGTAGELVGLAYLKQGQTKQAAPLFAGLAKDESVPQSIRTRALQMAGALGVDATRVVGTDPAKEAKQ